MPTAVKEEKFEINLDSAALDTFDPHPNHPLSRGVAMTIHEYVVPVGESLIFTPEDIFAMYFYSASEASEVRDVGTVDVVISDSPRQNYRSLLQVTRYSNVKEFTDKDQVRHLDVALGEQVIVREGERVHIRGETGWGGTIDGSECYFILTCKRIRHTLFE